jgi:hypothetical protein
MALPPDVSAHLDRFRDGLATAIDVRGLYLYGSLTTGDFSPACSDMDLVAVTEREPDKAALRRLRRLHLGLASAGGAATRLNCLYVPVGLLADPEHLHHYWYEDHFTQWRLKLMTRAELAASGHALSGEWPVPGLATVPEDDLRAAVRAEVDGYWRRIAGRRRLWRRDVWVDHGLVYLPRAAALLSSGELITKSQSIGRLTDFGVPAKLAGEIRRRREGEQVRLSRLQRRLRARTARRVMRAGVERLSAEGAPPAVGGNG